MLFPESYLSGSEFDNYRIFPLTISNQTLLETRQDLLLKLVKGKKIIHIGCVDHLEIIEEKIKKNQWVHKLITEASDKCLGIDINEEGIEFLSNKLGFKNVIVHNVINDDPAPEIVKEQWDFLVLGEILEHVDNPVEFLSALAEKYGKNVKGIIVTVPNAFNLNNFRNTLKNIEYINTDHRFWFTPYTLAKVFYRSGINPNEAYTCLFEPASSRGMLSKIMLRRFPLLRDTLVMAGSFRRKV
jgi:2-polyprenyl-3-methyl-5-hydroxy-6-metoxy-1,4-benzoquinol methylase